MLQNHEETQEEYLNRLAERQTHGRELSPLEQEHLKDGQAYLEQLAIERQKDSA